jgi:phage-related protein
MKHVREIVFFGPYFSSFYGQQTEKARRKIDYVLSLVGDVEKVPEKFLKHLEGTEGLYEIRIRAGNDAHRFFCFFDERRLLILLNGFQKNSGKTPSAEISRAKRLRKEYLANKPQEA